MHITSLLPIILLTTLASCGTPPSAGCVTTGLSALGEAGVYGDSQAGDITSLQCEQIQRIADGSGCGVGIYAYMRDHPEEAMASFASPALRKPGDAAGLVGPAAAVIQACDF